MLKLGDMLAPERVSFEGGIASQKQAFERLGELLSAPTGVDPGQVAAALSRRERLGTTGFGDGVAIPHGRVDGLGGNRAALILLAEPLDWQAVDALPVDLVVALVSDRAAGAGHLQALALIGRTLRDRQFVRKLRGAADAAALWAILDMADRRAA